MNGGNDEMKLYTIKISKILHGDMQLEYYKNIIKSKEQTQSYA